MQNCAQKDHSSKTPAQDRIAEECVLSDSASTHAAEHTPVQAD